jgi:hypothetical protein
MDDQKRPAGAKATVPARRRRRQTMDPAQRRQFLDELARSGDPEQAARALGVSMVDAFRLRDADPAFGSQWQAAVGFAWELLEMRLLADLLASPAAAEATGLVGEPTAQYQGGQTGPAATTSGQSGRRKAAAAGRLIDRLDSRLTMAIINRREAPPARGGTPRGPPMDSAAVARLRAELRDLADQGTKK